MDVKLKVLVGKSAGAELRIPSGKFFIGRADDCQLKPKSDLISRHHCVIMAEDDFVAVRDLGSRNGTYVNDARVAGECELRASDRLRVGPLEFEVVVEQKAKKHPKVNSIKEAAARTVAGANSGDLGDVGNWIGDDPDTPSNHAAPDDVTRIQKSPNLDQESLETEEISMGNTSVEIKATAAPPPAAPVEAPPAESPPTPVHDSASAPSSPADQAPQQQAPPPTPEEAPAPAQPARDASPPPQPPRPQITEADLPELSPDDSTAPRFIPRMAELKPFQADVDADEPTIQSDEPTPNEDPGNQSGDKKRKAQPAKLPPRANNTADSKAAAEDTLRKLFRRR